MKRFLTIFTLLLLSQSCSKEADISKGEIRGEVAKFTAWVETIPQSRASLKNSWNGDEEVALFVDETLYHYSIAADGTMTGDEIIVKREQEITYTAFYPYDAELATIEEYKAACVAGVVDYMSASTTTSGKAVDLTFKHSLAALSFRFVAEGSNPLTITLSLGDDTIPIELDSNIGSTFSKFETIYFIADGTDISSASIKAEHNGAISFLSFKHEGSSIFEAGKNYPLTCAIGNTPTGSGTPLDPYVVYFAEDMRKVGSGSDGWNLNSHYILAMDIDLGGIDAAGAGVAEKEFTTIGTDKAQFTGSFDGAGHKISGLYINKPEPYRQGLFSSATGATIKNLGVSGIVEGNIYIGGIVGDLDKSSVSDCYYEGSVKGVEYTGGVVGYSTDSKISNCYNIGSIEGSNYTGGVVGYTLSTDHINNCHNTGSIQGSDEFTGGVVGQTLGSVNGCYNTGSVEGNLYVGGVVGSSLLANDCYNTGSVEGNKTIGGVVGSSLSNMYTAAYAIDCYNVGSIKGSLFIGGVIGHSTASQFVERCYYDNEVVTGVIGALNGTDKGTEYCGLSTAMMKGVAETEGTLLYYFTQGESTAWEADTENINNGYPILKWQTANK